MSAKIQGVIRIRPHHKDETPFMTCSATKGFTLGLPDGPEYGDETFAAVLGPRTSQHDVFLTIGLPVVEAIMRGERACLFAYGQTGSGKTFSMYGADGGKNPSKLDGVVPAICAELFRRKQKVEARQGNLKIAMSCTLVEVRGSEIIDLIADSINVGTPDEQQPRCRLLHAEVQDAYRAVITSQSVLTDVIELGMKRRTTGCNMINSSSSRSHAFLTMFIEKTRKNNDGTLDSTKTCMHLIDLAGSEKYAATDKEGTNINQGLLSLGMVIMAKARGDPHVPYRDTMLTRMLRDTLEVDCTIVVLGCLNPGKQNLAETKNVLKFMERAAAITKNSRHVGILDQKKVLAAAAELVGGRDPLAGDQEDPDKYLSRRTEQIEIGGSTIKARCSGDPTCPLLLYIHSPGSKRDSKMWNSWVTALGARLRACQPADGAVASPSRKSKSARPSPPHSPAPAARLSEAWAGEGAEKAEARPPTSRGPHSPQRRSLSSSSAPRGSVTDRSQASRRRQASARSAPTPRSSVAAERGVSTSRRSAKGGKGAQETPRGGKGENETVDQPLSELRNRCFLLLRECRAELLRDLACALCSLPLVEPTRVVECRHMLCKPCAEASKHFLQCPICAGPIGGELHEDKVHSEIMRLRFEVMSADELLVKEQKRRIDKIAREQERSPGYMVLEFGVRVYGEDKSSSLTARKGGGATPPATPKGKPAAAEASTVAFARMVPDKSGEEIYCHHEEPPQTPAGAAGALESSRNPRRRRVRYQGEGEIRGTAIAHVTFGQARISQTAPGSNEFVAALYPSKETQQHMRMKVVVHWHKALKLDPVEIRFNAPANASFARRAVVHLPEGFSTGKGGSPPPAGGEEQVFDRVVLFDFEDKGYSANGTIHYQRDLVSVQRSSLGGARSQGTAHIQETLSYLQQQPERQNPDVAMRAVWLAKLARMSDPAVEKAIGSMNESVLFFMLGACRRLPLHELPALNVERHQTAMTARENMLIQSMSSACADPRVAVMYAEVQEFMHADPARLARVTQIVEGQGKHVIDDSNRPVGFFQVAIDVPDSMNSAVLQQLIVNLGKRFAYAVIADGQAAPMVLLSLIECERLTAYLVLKDPELPPSAPTLPKNAHKILQPTLLISEVTHSTPYAQRVASTISQLELALSNCSVAKLPRVELPKERAQALFDFFRASNWLGCMTGDDGDPSQPILTRLTGGYGSWTGLFKPPQKSKKERAQIQWIKARSAVRATAQLTATRMSKATYDMAPRELERVPESRPPKAKQQSSASAPFSRTAYLHQLIGERLADRDRDRRSKLDSSRKKE